MPSRESKKREKEPVVVTEERFDTEHPLTEKQRVSIERIEIECFGDGALVTLAEDLASSETFGALIKDPKTDEYIGFSYATPDPDGAKDAARVRTTAILKEYQKQGLVKNLNEAIEREACKRKYTFLTMQCIVSSGLPEIIVRHYGGRIVERGDVKDPNIRKRYFKIKLDCQTGGTTAQSEVAELKEAA